MVRQASIFLRLQWKTIGRENVDQKQPYVVVCNHQTGLDVLASAHVRNFMYRKRAIITRGLYIFYPIFHCGLY